MDHDVEVYTSDEEDYERVYETMTKPHHEQIRLENLTKYVGAFTYSLAMKTLTMFLEFYRQRDIVILQSNAVQTHSSCIAL